MSSEFFNQIIDAFFVFPKEETIIDMCECDNVAFQVAEHELKESDVRPREIPSPKDSVFLADMRSHHRLAESGEMLREPGANFLGGVENDL